MATEPKLYTRNYVDGDCEITVSSGSASKQKLYDHDNASKWISSGENNDATESIIQVNFKQNGQVVSREIDTLILVNHNLEDPILERWDGAAWQSLDSETNLTDGTYTKMSFVAVETERIRIRNSQTIIVDAEKFVGELIACALLFETTDEIKELGSYDPSLQQRNANDIQLADGSLHRVIIMHSPNRSAKYECRARVDYVSAVETAELQTIKDRGQAFLWQPESVAVPSEIYLVHWVGPFRKKYVSSNKGSGYQIDFDLREV